MLTLIDLVTTAATAVYRGEFPSNGDTLEITWRRYGYDLDELWYLEIDVRAAG